MNAVAHALHPRVFWAAVVAAGVVVLAIVSRLAGSGRSTAHNATQLRVARRLVQQAMRWHEASDQDSNPLFAARHASYAVAYLNAARALLPDVALEQCTRVDVHALIGKLEVAEQARARALTERCPRANPSKRHSGARWTAM